MNHSHDFFNKIPYANQRVSCEVCGKSVIKNKNKGMKRQTGGCFGKPKHTRDGNNN